MSFFIGFIFCIGFGIESIFGLAGEIISLSIFILKKIDKIKIISEFNSVGSIF